MQLRLLDIIRTFWKCPRKELPQASDKGNQLERRSSPLCYQYVVRDSRWKDLDKRDQEGVEEEELGDEEGNLRNRKSGIDRKYQR